MHHLVDEDQTVETKDIFC